tara:strand:+ start:22676 stop:23437 length:762 start_codon:yes stop_codon:yes gene_type:complete
LADHEIMGEPSTKENWFQKWFNTPYYHMLYHQRDNMEAKLFITNLIQELKPKADSHFLDLACGKGRHSLFLNQQGFEVTGMDLSEESINFAQQHASDSLHFYSGDMREPYGENRFDFILNLFTSFGYFENNDDNRKVCEQIAKALKPGGKVLIDFLNVSQLERGLVPQDEFLIEDCQFAIERKIVEDKVLKTIKVKEGNKEKLFYECVQLLHEEDFKNLLHESGLHYEQSFGGYTFEPYSAQKSKRLIILASK